MTEHSPGAESPESPEPPELSRPPEQPVASEADPDVAAAAALARARAAAAARGLRPGSAPHRRRARPVDQAYSSSTRDGRDPALIGEQIDKLLIDRGWRVDVSAGAVMGRWAAIVGPEIAQHATPVTFTDGELLLRADSTAWATELRLQSGALLARLEEEVGAGVVQRLRIVGPSAPSWRKGPRRVAGRGPRDTYG